MKVAAGMAEGGIVIGNTYDKYGSRNPIVRRIMMGFSDTLSSLVERASPIDIHEVGCGEGYWIQHWTAQGIRARGSDFSEKVISLASANAKGKGIPEKAFLVRSIYDLERGRDSADLIVCCEVLEHLEDPLAGITSLQRIVTNHLIVSVPREPVWRMLNMMRGKYWGQLGNTPGHLNHWSSSSFIRFISQYFNIVEIRKPFPWTMLLCRAKH